jgi:putative spermidine/putrescine transport system permease protein
VTWLRRPDPGSVLVGALALFTGAFLMFPVIVVLPISFSSEAYLSFPPPGLSLRWYQTLFGSREWMDAMRTSFMIAIPTAILSVALGTAAAYGLVRGRFRGRRAIRLLVIAPMIVPNIIVAIGLYGVYSDLHVVGTATAVVLGHVVLATPLAVITITAALQGFDPMFERAALSLGAPPLTTFRRITLPLILPAILAGGVFAFSASFDELLVALFVSGVSSRTLPRQMWEQLQLELSPTIAAASVVILLVSVGLLGCLMLFRRGVSAAQRRAPVDSAGVQTIHA